MTWTILQADARHIPLADKSVQCVVTSPPYWGLRDYGQVGQIGLEPTPEAYVEQIVAVFAEVWRVLRDDGTCWVNLGDCYAATSYGSGGGWALAPGADGFKRNDRSLFTDPGYQAGLKPKNLVGIPWRVAFALQAAGWYLRSDIIWSKPNPMPESVTDRPTKAHEYIFLLTKRERYFFDQDAVREESTESSGWAKQRANGKNTWAYNDTEQRIAVTGQSIEASTFGTIGSRNIRTVWEIATQPYPEAHFATFPEEIARRCIKAGTSEKGCCAECGAPWERIIEKPKPPPDLYTGTTRPPSVSAIGNHYVGMGQKRQNFYNENPPKTTGWQPTCTHDAPTVPCIVLDPFSGAGTVPLVSDKLNRRGIGLELKADYCRMASRRCYDDAPLLSSANIIV